MKRRSVRHIYKDNKWIHVTILIQLKPLLNSRVILDTVQQLHVSSNYSRQLENKKLPDNLLFTSARHLSINL